MGKCKQQIIDEPVNENSDPDPMEHYYNQAHKLIMAGKANYLTQDHYQALLHYPKNRLMSKLQNEVIV